MIEIFLTNIKIRLNTLRWISATLLYIIQLYIRSFISLLKIKIFYLLNENGPLFTEMLFSILNLKIGSILTRTFLHVKSNQRKQKQHNLTDVNSIHFQY